MGPDRESYRLLWYLVGVFGLAGVTLALLATLFITRVPEFTDAFVRNPVQAGRGDPVAVALVFGTVVSTLLLIGLIVGFGARSGVLEPEEPEQSDR